MEDMDYMFQYPQGDAKLFVYSVNINILFRNLFHSIIGKEVFGWFSMFKCSRIVFTTYTRTIVIITTRMLNTSILKYPT